jgi:hypothetical protein
MSGPLVTLRTIDHEFTYELVITDRSTGECQVIRLNEDQLNLLSWQFSDAILRRHACLKRLSRPQIPPSVTSHNDTPQHPDQHQAAAE